MGAGRSTNRCTSLFTLLFLVLAIPSALAATYQVKPSGAPDCVSGAAASFTTIQAAVDFASPGDEIRVCAGTYAESVGIGNIGKDDLTLRANNTTFDVVLLGSLAVQGSRFGVSHLMFEGFFSTLDFIQTNDGRVSDNLFKTKQIAIELEASSNVTIENNTFLEIFDTSILVKRSGGLPSANNTFRNNTLDNVTSGVRIVDSVDNLFESLTVTNAGSGIELTGSSPGNRIRNSSLFNNEVNLRNAQAADVDAILNFWGTVDCAAINASIVDRQDDPSFGVVLFEPFLNAPPPAGKPRPCVLPPGPARIVNQTPTPCRTENALSFHQTIGDALAAAAPGDEVVVCAGYYPEVLLQIDKDGVTIRAQNTTFDVAVGKSSSSPIITIAGRRVTVSNLAFAGNTGDGVLAAADDANISFNRFLIRDRSPIHVQGKNATIIGNDISGVLYETGGIFLDRATNATLRDNVLFGNTGGIRNLQVVGDDCSHFNHSIDGSNSVNGLPVIYLFNETGRVISGGASDAVWIACSRNVTVRDLTQPGEKDGLVSVLSSGTRILNSTFWGDVLVDRDRDDLLQRNTIQSESRGNGSTAGGQLVLTGSQNITVEENENRAVRGVEIRLTTGSQILGNNFSSIGTGILLAAAHNNTVENNTINGTSLGILLGGSNDNILRNNSTGRNLAGGIRLQFFPNSRNIIDGNRINENGGHPLFTGALFIRGEGNLITKNEIRENGNGGVRTMLGANNTVAKNQITRNGNFGILLSGPDHRVLENTVADTHNPSGTPPPDAGVIEALDRDILRVMREVLGNESLDFDGGPGGAARPINSSVGLLLEGGNITVEGNTVVNTTAGDDGIGISISSPGATVENNTVVLNSHYGIIVSSSSSVRIASNNVSLNGLDGIRVLGSENITISDNTASFNNRSGLGGNGILVADSQFTNLSNNTASNNTNGIHLNRTSNNTATVNTAIGNVAPAVTVGGDGFRVIQSPNSSIVSNTALDNLVARPARLSLF